MDNQTFSELVGAIYDCAVDVTLWPQALGRICDHFGFRKGTIDLNRVPSMTSLFNYNYGIDDRQAQTMLSHYRGMPEVWGGLAASMERPIDRPWIVSRIMTQEELRQTAYYQHWVGPMGLVDGAAIVLARDNALFGSIRLATDSQVGMIDDRLAYDLALLLPHCQRAARISGLIDASLGAVRNFQAVIDSMVVPILLVSSDCAVVHANPRARAMLDNGSVLKSVRGRLVSQIPGLQRAIDNAIRRLSEDETDIPGNGIGLSIRAPDQSLRTLHLLPLAQGDMRTRLAGDAVAAIFISTVSVEQDFVRDVLQPIFELTNAEIGVFKLIIAGRTTQQISAELDVAASTVRTHVQHLFEKTATHRRADLIRLAHALAPPVTPALS